TVANIFKEIIPYSSIYNNNFYRFGGKGKTAENDLLVIIDDVLFVIEVKGSSFPLNSVMNDPEANFKSYKKLIKEGDDQSKRFINFLKDNESIKVYNED